MADQSVLLDGIGTAAYLDMEQVIGVAKEQACEAVHLCCGLLAKNDDFTPLCSDKNILFVGPTADTRS